MRKEEKVGRMSEESRGRRLRTAWKVWCACLPTLRRRSDLARYYTVVLNFIVKESSFWLIHLRIRQARQKGDNVIHHVLIVNDAVLTLFYQHDDEVAKTRTEFFPHGT